MADDTTRTSNRKLNSGASEYNAISFLVEQQMKGGINTAIPVRVESCTKPGSGGAAGYVSATPLVMQRGADGNSLPPVAMPKLPFFRLYAGTAAVVIDPQPGDVGLAIFSQQDASNLEAGKNEPVQAGSFRSFDMSDGFYVGGFLGTVPDVFCELEQSTGIKLQTPSNVITIGREDGVVTIKANTSVNVEAPIAKCSGDVEIAGTLKTGGMATFQSGLQTAAGTNASIGGSLTAARDISAGGDFSGGGGISMGGNASFGGSLDTTGAATFGSTLGVTGASTFDGAASFANTITATGAATFNDVMAVAGTATFGGTVDVENTLTANSLVTGDITAAGDLSISGNTTIDGDLSITGSLSSSGGLTLDGNVTIDGRLDVGSISAENLSVSDDAYIGGTLDVNGRSTLASAKVSSIITREITSTTSGPSLVAFACDYVTFSGSIQSIGQIRTDTTVLAMGNIRSEGTISAPTIQQDAASP